MAVAFVWFVIVVLATIVQCILLNVSPTIAAAVEWTAVLTGVQVAESPVGGPCCSSLLGLLAVADLLTLSPGPETWRVAWAVPLEGDIFIVLVDLILGCAALGGADYITAAALLFALLVRAARLYTRLTRII
jgi:hypothetical protein